LPYPSSYPFVIPPPPYLPIPEHFIVQEPYVVPHSISVPDHPRTTKKRRMVKPASQYFVPDTIAEPLLTPPPPPRNRAAYKRRSRSQSAPRGASPVREKIREVVLTLSDEIAFSLQQFHPPPPPIPEAFTTAPHYNEGLQDLDTIDPMNPDQIRSFIGYD
jgi:hypothetical protein